MAQPGAFIVVMGASASAPPADMRGSTLDTCRPTARTCRFRTRASLNFQPCRRRLASIPHRGRAAVQRLPGTRDPRTSFLPVAPPQAEIPATRGAPRPRAPHRCGDPARQRPGRAHQRSEPKRAPAGPEGEISSPFECAAAPLKSLATCRRNPPNAWRKKLRRCSGA